MIGRQCMEISKPDVIWKSSAYQLYLNALGLDKRKKYIWYKLTYYHEVNVHVITTCAIKEYYQCSESIPHVTSQIMHTWSIFHWVYFLFGSSVHLHIRYSIQSSLDFILFYFLYCKTSCHSVALIIIFLFSRNGCF